MSNTKTDRNKELVKDYLELKKQGRPMISLVMKYKITTQRIYTLLKREGIDLNKSDS